MLLGKRVESLKYVLWDLGYLNQHKYKLKLSMSLLKVSAKYQL